MFEILFWYPITPCYVTESTVSAYVRNKVGYPCIYTQAIVYKFEQKVPHPVWEGVNTP